MSNQKADFKRFFFIFSKIVLEAERHYRFIFVVTINFQSRYFCDNTEISISIVRFMFSMKKNTFNKGVNCPSSEKLLAYQNGDDAAATRDKITVHLRFCEFCAAEAELYSRFPQADEQIEKSDIPIPLYELAKALMRNNQHDDFSSLERLLNQEEENLVK
jgi:hypothetical protein